MSNLSLTDIKHLFKLASSIRESEFSEDVTNEGIFDWAKKKKAQPVSYEHLYDKWEDEGRPTDSAEIISLLLSAGFTKKEVTTMFNKLDIAGGSDANISDLAVFIQKKGLATWVLKYLESQKMTESVLTEKTLSNKSIRDLFYKIVDYLPAEKKPANPEPGTENGTLTASYDYTDEKQLNQVFETAIALHTYGRIKK